MFIADSAIRCVFFSVCRVAVCSLSCIYIYYLNKGEKRVLVFFRFT